MSDQNEKINRRSFFLDGARMLGALCIGGIGGITVSRLTLEDTVWQIDPSVCVRCGRCALHCTLPQSAVKCVHSFDVCGYCDLCGGYLQPTSKVRDTAAENQLCPTGAIARTYIEDPYFEYIIDESLCNGCGKCVEGCASFGNGSLYLQVRHDICLNCNQCEIARVCPSGAFRRVPATDPYLLRGQS